MTGLGLLTALVLTAKTGVVDIPAGECRLSSAEASRFDLYISNHDHVPSRAVVFPIVGATNLTVRGHGSRLVIDGEAIAFMIRDSANVAIEGIDLDYALPSCREAVITSIRDGETRFRMIDPYRKQGVSMIRLFRGDTREMLPGVGEVCLDCDAEFSRGAEGVLKHDFSKDGAGARVGDMLVFRKRNPDRPCPAIFIENSKDVVLRDCVVHTADGMGLLAQVSENVTWSGGGVYPRDGHYASTQADATHFSNVKGCVLVENCRFEGMMDDAINVHSTCLSVEAVDGVGGSDGNVRVRARFMHPQAYGFVLFHAGDVMRFLQADTLDAVGEGTVCRVTRESDRVVMLEMAVPQPTGFVGEASCLPLVRQDAAPTGGKISYVLENATYQCSATFRNNRVLRNRARGALFTTPHPVRIESNVFERVTGAALLFSGDAGSWYESGSCRDVVIRGNVFRDCMFAVSDWSLSKAVISFNPVVEDPAAEKTRYHRNITIADNVFDMFPAPLVYASCVSNLTFVGNEVRRNRDYPDRRDARPFIVKDSEDVNIWMAPSLASETAISDWEFSRDGRTWTSVRVPHDWAIAGPFDRTNDLQKTVVREDGELKPKEHSGRTGGLPWTGVGFYRRTFDLAPDVRTAELVFDGAMSHAAVFSDGERIGGHAFGYAPFVVRLPVKPRQVVTVRCENPPSSSRWYPGAGLYRPVRLRTNPRCRPEDVVVRTECLTATQATVRVISPLGDRTFTVANPRIWTPETPYLQTLEPEGVRYGIRTVGWTNGVFELNGVRRKIRGVCLHHDLGPLGAAFNAAAFRRQVRLLKEMGCDAIRTAHNIPSSDQLAICDEMGMMVMAESFDEWRAEKCANGYHRDFDACWKDDLAALVKFHGNHPSVVMWSIGNEIPDQVTAVGTKLSAEMQDFVHRLDPTRPVTQGHSWMPQAIAAGGVGVMDVPGVTYRLKFYPALKAASRFGGVLGAETASTVSSRGVYKFPAEVTEDGEWSDGQCSSYDLGACNWSNLPDDDFAMQDDHDWVMGEFVWTGFDYLGEPTPYKTYWPSRSSYFGIFDLAGLPKDRHWLYRSRWRSDSPTLHLLPHWTWSGREGQTTPVYCYTSYPAAELFVNGVSQGRRAKDPASRLDRYRLRWNDVVYQPGEIKVVAYDAAGNRAGEASVRTAGAPAGLVLEADRAVLSAAGSDGMPDLAFVTVRVVDRDGNLCPDAARSLSFAAEGAVRYACACNGDATSLEPFQGTSMRTFHGQLVIVVEAAGRGKGCLRVTAEGLASGSCAFQVKE